MTALPRKPVRSAAPVVTGALLALIFAVAPQSADAVVRAWLAPVSGVFTSPDPRFNMCSTMEWELVIENDSDMPEFGVLFRNNVNDGFGPGNFGLVCPPTLLPPGIDPAVDVDCNLAPNTIEVRNLDIPACSRVRLKYETTYGGVPLGQFQCDGGQVISGGGADFVFTSTPIANPDFREFPPYQNNTCVNSQAMCNMDVTQKIHVYKSAITGRRTVGAHVFPQPRRGAVLRGELLNIATWIDLRFMTLIPSLGLNRYHTNLLGFGWNLDALPPNLDFLSFQSYPLNTNNTAVDEGIYTYDAATRELWYEDEPSTLKGQMVGGQVTELMDWNAQISCSTAGGDSICYQGGLLFGGRAATDDPTSQQLIGDENCFYIVEPDLSTSSKTITDAGSSGDAQPGEYVTFHIDVTNSFANCPLGPAMSCECAATDVQVVDIVDTNRIQFNTIRAITNGGTTIAPDQVVWNIPSVGPLTTSTVSFEARVRAEVTNGQQVCNDASITAAELTNIADGGISNCATQSPVNVNACMPVVVPPALLVVDKAISAPAGGGPYPVGSTIEYSITVTNAGTGPADLIEVWDCLDTAWAGATVTPLDLGVLNAPPPPPGCVTGQWIRWSVGSLAASGSTTVRFEVTVPFGMVDMSVVPNRAEAGDQQASEHSNGAK